MAKLPFRDRDDAARQLADALARYRGAHPVLLAIPRGAVPMSRLIADALGGDLDVVLVRKLGAPGNPEFALGAVDEAGDITLNEETGWWGGDERYLQEEARRQLALIRERRATYRGGSPPLPLAGRTAIVVDDGLATGATMMAALRWARAQAPARLVCAVPVAAADSLRRAGEIADDVVCLATPTPFHAVGLHYRNFPSVSDEQVVEALAATAVGAAKAGDDPSVRIPAGPVSLEGDLVRPADASGLVVFVHGSGSSRHSPRNRAVAQAMNRLGLATLLFDLLTPDEDDDRENRFDIGLLAQRLAAVLAWTQGEPALRALPIGLFGASTGAAAALRAAADHPGRIAAVVSRGGRPDLAGRAVLARVQAPTLLIVGSRDPQVRELNEAAATAMPNGTARLLIVPGATHLFEEPGTLEAVAEAAGEWFRRWLVAAATG